MKKLLLFIMACFVIVSCSKFDDTSFKVEELCKQMNQDIASFRDIIVALQNNDYVTGVEPVNSDDGTEIGYKITFSKNGSIIIYHAKDGEKGHTPIISAKKDEDKLYYWTINGEWLLDEQGNKLPVDGKNGITPQLKIKNGYWYISTDNGSTWTQAGKASGEDRDFFFQNVKVSETEVIFTLTDGTYFSIPLYSELSIIFDEKDLTPISPNSTRNIHYEIQSVASEIEIEAISSSDLKAKIVKDTASNLKGIIEVKTGDTIDEYSKIVILVSNGVEVVMKSISFEEAGLIVADNANKEIPASGGELILEFFTNVPYYAVIPDDAKSWIEPVETKTMEKRTLLFTVKENTGADRVAKISVESVDGNLNIVFTVHQKAINNAINNFINIYKYGFYKFSDNGNTLEIVYQKYICQYAFVKKSSSSNSFRIVEPIDKYFIIDQIPATLILNQAVQLTFTQNFSDKISETHQMNTKVVKIEDNTIWLYDNTLNEGIIIKIEE